jgi:hypothetical protein
VALGLPAGDRFWAAPDPSSDWRPPDDVAAAAAGLSLTRRWSGTTLHNARTGHPADIADHDYAATYGKLAYRSAFPFDLPVEHPSEPARPASGPAADGALIAIGAGGALAHRNESIAGSAGPGWITSRYRLPTAPRPTLVRTVALVLDRVEVRVSLVRSPDAVRVREAPATLGVDDASTELQLGDRDGCVSVTDGRRTIAIRALLGYGASGWAGTTDGLANLIHDRSCHPYVEEPVERSGPRLLATAVLAIAADVDPVAALAGVTVTPSGPNAVEVRWPGGAAALRLGRQRPAALGVEGVTVRGPGLHVVRVDGPGSGTSAPTSIAGEPVAEIAGVARFDRAGVVAVRQVDEGVQVTTASGFRLDPGWAGRPLVHLRARRGAGPWRSVGLLEEAGVVPDALVRRQLRLHGTRLVELRLDGGS